MAGAQSRITASGPSLLVGDTLPASVSQSFRAESITLSSSSRTPLEVDGELIGQLPATFSVQRSRLRVIAP